MHRARPGRCADARGTLRTPLGRASVPLEPTPMPMPACLAAARFRALARLADLVSRAYIQCMAEMAEDPRRSAERRRALELLAASPDGCTAAILLAHGFKSDRLVELINAGLASVTTERVIAGDRAMKVTRVRITDAGRQALDRPKARR
jgi:hypothetical protein